MKICIEDNEILPIYRFKYLRMQRKALQRGSLSLEERSNFQGWILPLVSDAEGRTQCKSVPFLTTIDGQST